MTKIEIIDETVEFYKNNSRAIMLNENGVESGCAYFTEGHKCAHSRCLTEEALLEVTKHYNTMTAYSVIEKLGDECHLEQYRGHDGMFWNDVQKIHDTTDYWNGREFTEAGQIYVNMLKKQYNPIIL